MHPELAWILDISPDEEALTAGMRKTTRYSIRKAEKDGVTVTMTRNMSAIDTFYRIYKETEQRQHFVAFSRDYIEKELKAFSIDTESEAQLFFAEYGGSVLATALIIFTPWQAFYHQGASSSGNSKIPASYLLQWRGIQETRRRGCTAYNFWGVSPLGRERHPWAGLSLFKRGFGGREEAYLHAQDLVLRPRYWLTYALETVRNKKRGF